MGMHGWKIPPLPPTPTDDRSRLMGRRTTSRLGLIRARSKRPAKPTSRTRIFYLVVIPPLAIAVGVLTYGLLQRSLFRPRVDATVERTDMFVKAGEHIQVNVINACGTNGLAMKFTEFLRARKFDVPEYATSKNREQVSKVIDRIGDRRSAEKVAYALGIEPKNIEQEIDSTLYLRATVVIGEDYMTLRPMK